MKTLETCNQALRLLCIFLLFYMAELYSLDENSQTPSSTRSQRSNSSVKFADVSFIWNNFSLANFLLKDAQIFLTLELRFRIGRTKMRLGLPYPFLLKVKVPSVSYNLTVVSKLFQIMKATHCFGKYVFWFSIYFDYFLGNYKSEQ